MNIFRDLELKLACLAFVLTTTMVTLNVFLRYLMGQSLLFSEEVAYLGFAHTIFLGAAYLYRMRVMISVEFVVDMLSNDARRIVLIVSLFILQATMLAMTYISALLASDGWVRRTAYLEMPYAYIHSAPVIGFLLMSIYTAIMIYQTLSGQELHFAEAADQK